MSLVKNKFKRERHLQEALAACKYSLDDMKKTVSKDGCQTIIELDLVIHILWTRQHHLPIIIY